MNIHSDPQFITASPAFMRAMRRNDYLDFMERKPGSGAAIFRAIERGDFRLMMAENSPIWVCLQK